MGIQTVKIKLTGSKENDIRNIMHTLNINCFDAEDIYKALSKSEIHDYQKHITRTRTRTIRIEREGK